MVRKLRVAVSVFFGVMTVALCVLWPRSYSYSDQVSYTRNAKSSAGISTLRGVLRFSVLQFSDLEAAAVPLVDGWHFGSYKVDPGTFALGGRQFEWRNREPQMRLRLPLWFVAGICMLTSALTMRVRRFSLRTLLIATTLLAVVLGLAAWAGQ